MRFDELRNCLYVPPGNKRPGTIYLLGEEQDDPAASSFVVIPYVNGAAERPKPRYFPITGAAQWEGPPFLAFTEYEYPILVRPGTSREEYIEKVKKLKEEIAKGNVYEINYCMEFFVESVTLDPLNVFLKLNELSKAPYSYLLKVGSEHVICCSPELFLEKKGKKVITKPVKGTIRRGANPVEDEALKQELQTSLKERTENVMAVDVARNDLSMFAKKGTVKVNKLYNIETFETVHQMVSTVSCESREEVTFRQMIEASFPMASMTGAPKISAMKLISETEDFERGYYSGAMGFHSGANFSLAVVIRSIFYNSETKRLSFAVGSAITYLSDPEKEYEECLLKANTMMKALNAYHSVSAMT
jgi:para-aminobenzoate synthetase component I